jgi:hypothetical protein
MLREQEVREYIAIYKKVYGKEISYEEAMIQGTKLLRLVKLIYKPMTEQEYNQLQKRRQNTI